jgi:hypothetical protein
MRVFEILLGVFLLLIDILIFGIFIFGITEMIKTYENFNFIFALGIILYAMIAIFIILVGCFAIQIMIEEL